MVNVVITGGAGMLGARLARQILAAGELEVAGEPARPVSTVTLVDQVRAPADLLADARVSGVQGDVAAVAETDKGALAGADVIFHLAAAVSGECEADFDLGMRANLRATEALFATCRALGSRPVVVFASSLAVFGGSREHPLPAVMDDQTLPNPQTSYGTQKFIAEQLLADYTRKGFFRGRALRLVTVCVRPGRPNAAATGFLSGIIREPWRGSGRAALSTRRRRPLSHRRARRSRRCCAPPPRPTRRGAVAPRSRCPRSPCRSLRWPPRSNG